MTHIALVAINARNLLAFSLTWFMNSYYVIYNAHVVLNVQEACPSIIGLLTMPL
jgi:hypothetical protein